MATRRPIVVVGGRLAELPAGDTLPGAGGSAPVFAASVNVAPAQWYQADVVLANAAVTAASNVLVNLVPNADWDADDLADFEVFATPGAGQLALTITRPGPIVGDFDFDYLIG